MNWLVIQSDGMHKGQDGWCPNWMFRECYAIRYALERLGHRTEVWGLRHDNFEHRPDLSAFDAVFVAENYEFGWLPDLGAAKQVFFWMIDAHIEPASRYDPILRQSHVVLHSSQRHVHAYSQRFPDRQHLYFPNGVDDRFFDAERHPPRLRTDPLIFIGGKGASRAAALDRMQSECGLKYAYGITGMDYVAAVLDAKMQFNMPANGDINYRTWETLGLGCCLLTQHDPELENLGLMHRTNCLMYTSVDEAVQLARHYLTNGEWSHVAAAGYALSKRHSYTARMHEMLLSLSRSGC